MAQCNWDLSWENDWEKIFAPAFRAGWQSAYDSPSRVGPASPFFHPDVVKAWFDSQTETDSLNLWFLTAVAPSGTTVLWPFVSRAQNWKKGFLRKLRPLGAGMFDYSDPIVVRGPDDRATVSEICIDLAGHLPKQLSQQFDEIDIPSLRVEAVMSRYAGLTSTDKSPFVSLTPFDGIDSFMASRKKNLRGDVKRRLRRGSEMGDLHYQTHLTVANEEVRGWIDDLDRNRRARYGEAAPVKAFLTALLEKASYSGGPAWFTALYLDDKSIAWHAGFKHAGTAFWFVPSFDPAAEGMSPGKLHVYFSMQDAIETNCDCFDFMRGEESYKSGWSEGEMFQSYRFQSRSTTTQSKIRRVSTRLSRRWIARSRR